MSRDRQTAQESSTGADISWLSGMSELTIDQATAFVIRKMFPRTSPIGVASTEQSPMGRVTGQVLSH
ncbi:hypothetical protein RRG08_027989 [Elysia crispata]|uniref:Uncharacterized protein n=1 Tax=Elysia crispata TaxID=231223 RepID=A0AAE1BD53_9GAST|nr:hypothetical protein RRG08_027989 [Elysia crispata]